MSDKQANLAQEKGAYIKTKFLKLKIKLEIFDSFRNYPPFYQMIRKKTGCGRFNKTFRPV